jgi:hypothetical protein
MKPAHEAQTDLKKLDSEDYKPFCEVEKRDITIFLDDAGKEEAKQNLLDTIDAIEAKEAEIKEVSKGLRDELKRLKSESAKYHKALKSGQLPVHVEGLLVYNGRQGKVWFEHQGKRYLERQMHSHEYLKGQPTLFEEREAEIAAQNELAKLDSPDAKLVASTEDGKVTKLRKGPRTHADLEQSKEEAARQRDLDEVRRSESSVKGKADLVSEVG